MTATIEELFTSAQSLPTAERDEFLRRACGADADLYARVHALVNASCLASQFVKDEPCRPEPEDRRLIDDYRLVEELGQGGGGVVYLAEQLTPIKREVALKIIKLGMDTREVINRFEAERQALAMMDHPSIAKVFSAGATPTGRPYFAMELVRGIKITDYCNQCRLTVAERLELFIQICSAIEHAHQRHIVHRDIKPSNVLVTLHGGAALAKVIDFGVAKATQGRLTEQTLFTLLDQFIGTPAYVSPEQTASNSNNVDDRSDIYSLGVLLYELLTGTTPLDTRELSGATLEDVRRRIREEVPLVPSKRLQQLQVLGRRERSMLRQTNMQSLVHGIRADLDWIVMRCLEKDRVHRYRSVNDLAADLKRYLRSEPVSARPPTLIYTLRRLAARNRPVFAAAASIAGVLVIATAVSTWQAVRATHAEKVAHEERETAEQVSQFLLNVFGAADPFVNLGREPTARDLLDRAARNIQNDSALPTEVRVRLLEAIARSYRRMADPARAIVLFEEALRLSRSMRQDDAALGLIVTGLAVSLREEGRVSEAERYFKEAQLISRRLEGDYSEVHARLLLDLGRFERVRSHPKQALRYITAALEMMRALKGGESIEAAEALTDLSNVLLWTDDLTGAERFAREAVRLFQIVPEHHPDRVFAEYSLAEILLYQGRIEEAGLLYERALDGQRKLYGPNNSIVADTLSAIAQVRLAEDRVSDAEGLLNEALDSHRLAGSTAHWKIGYLQTVLAAVWLRGDRWADAERLLRGALELFSKDLHPDHQYIASAEHYLGEALLAQKKTSAAETVLIAAIDRWKRSGAPAWRAARSASALGEALRQAGRTREAEPYVVDSYRVLTRDPGVDPDSKRLARERVLQLYEGEAQSSKRDALLNEPSRAETRSTPTT